jgi:hypothetical protein
MNQVLLSSTLGGIGIKVVNPAKGGREGERVIVRQERRTLRLYLVVLVVLVHLVFLVMIF